MRIRGLVGVIVVSVAVFAVPAAAHGVTVGSTIPAAGGIPGPGLVLDTTDPPGGPSYAVPSPGGVVTSATVQAKITSGSAQTVRVLLMTGSGSQYTVSGHVDITVSSTLIAAATASARVPVAAGARVGVYTATNTVSLGGVTIPGAVASAALPTSDPQDGSVETLEDSGVSDAAFSVSVEVEPDADKDGFGDQTQDLCPSQAATHGPCIVPNTKITKGPSQTRKPTVKYSFKSGDPTSTFECRITGKGVHSKKLKRFKACRSPKTYKNLAPGHYTFFVRAVSAGAVDPSPAKVKLVVRGAR